MRNALQVHFLNMTPSEAVEARIRRWGERLSRLTREIQSCHVWVESARGHHHKGNIYGVRIRLRVPAEEIDVELQPADEDVCVCVRSAFDAARRRLQDYERRRRDQIKSHPRAPGDRSRRRLVLPEQSGPGF